MLQIKISDAESYDEVHQRFVNVKGQTLQLEHSLVSISKWESKWKRPFLQETAMTPEQTLDYIKCMTITQNVDPAVYLRISQEQVELVKQYIDDPMTATTISKIEGSGNGGGSRTVMTSEVIYYYMTAYNIPFDPCQKWHLNRLLMLIKVCDEKNSPKKKMSRRQAAANYKSLNAARRAKNHSRG